MTAPLYGDLATLKEMLGIGPTDTTRDTLLTQKLTAASRRIDGYCGRRFYLDQTTSQRIISPQRKEHWYVDGGGIRTWDIGSKTGLIIEEGYQGYTGSPVGTWTDMSNDFVLMPDDALTDTMGTIWPITAFRRAIGVIQDPYILVRVTAQWGWPAVPDTVTDSALLLASRLYRRKDSPEGVLGNSEWGAVRVSRIDPDVAADLDPFVLGGFA